MQYQDTVITQGQVQLPDLWQETVYNFAAQPCQACHEAISIHRWETWTMTTGVYRETVLLHAACAKKLLATSNGVAVQGRIYTLGDS